MICLFDADLVDYDVDLRSTALKFACFDLGRVMDYATLRAVVTEPLVEAALVDTELADAWAAQYLVLRGGRLSTSPHGHTITGSVAHTLSELGLLPDEVLVCVSSFDTIEAEEAIDLGCFVIDPRRCDIDAGTVAAWKQMAQEAKQ